MDRRLPMAVVALAVPAGGLHAQTATAAPPNDSPFGAGVFEPYTAPNGVPTEQEAAADLATATADAGVPRCLGSSSFARTVWYRIPEGSGARALTVEAVGRTADPIDLAAFVQPHVPPPPAPTPTAQPTPVPTSPPARTSQASLNTREPNACDGVGAGGGADSPDAIAAVSLLVPGGYPVLVQVGRRGPVGAFANEQVLLALDAPVVTLAPTPRGDSARTAPRLRSGENPVDLAGATITSEDPAQPPCPSLGTVWRKLVPGSTGRRLIGVSGTAATSFTVFAGRRPTGDNAVDCVNRRGNGAMQMAVDVKQGRTAWVRVGVDRFAGDEEATVNVKDGTFSTIINGGPGGFDPTPGGAAGGLPEACDKADATRATVLGRSLSGRTGDYNRFTRVPVSLAVSDSPVCDATLRLYGPRGHIYAKGRYIRLKPGRRRVTIPRLRTFVAGRYHLETTGVDASGDRARATTDLTGRLLRGRR